MKKGSRPEVQHFQTRCIALVSSGRELMGGKKSVSTLNILCGHGARDMDAMAFRCVDQILFDGHWSHTQVTVDRTERRGRCADDGGRDEITKRKESYRTKTSKILGTCVPWLIDIKFRTLPHYNDY